jgi:hypothetical protein
LTSRICVSTDAPLEVVGPVFTRIWDLQGGFAERLKRVIEPAFTSGLTSHIENTTARGRERLLGLRRERGDEFTLRPDQPGVCAEAAPWTTCRGSTREIMTVGLQQTYYSDPQSGGCDSSYQSTYGTGDRSTCHRSPTARVSPWLAVRHQHACRRATSRRTRPRTVSFGGNVNVAAVGRRRYSRSRLDPTNHSKFIRGRPRCAGWTAAPRHL